MALKPNFSVQLSDTEALKRIAAQHGYTQKRGQEEVGSIRGLLEAIIAGEVTIVKTKPLTTVSGQNGQ